MLDDEEDEEREDDDEDNDNRVDKWLFGDVDDANKLLVEIII